jgi:hypothetical protein
MDRIDIDGGSVNQIGHEEEVVGSGGIGAEKAGDPDGSDNECFQMATWIGSGSGASLGLCQLCDHTGPQK